MADERVSRGGISWLAIAGILLALSILIVPLILHFGQKRHDVLPFDVDAQFPADKPIVGGEVFAGCYVEGADGVIRLAVLPDDSPPKAGGSFLR